MRPAIEMMLRVLRVSARVKRVPTGANRGFRLRSPELYRRGERLGFITKTAGSGRCGVCGGILIQDKEEHIPLKGCSAGGSPLSVVWVLLLF
jgi:hypothetical protein